MVPYADSLSLDKTIQTIYNQTEFNSFEVLNKHKMVSKNKACMTIPMCQMIFISVVHPTLKIDIF
jgi:hypothetical protein